MRIDPATEGARDRLVLFDFGAARAVPEEFLNCYRLLMQGGLARDARLVEKGGRQLGLLLPEDPQELVLDYVELCFLLVEPFSLTDDGTDYDWAATDLPKRVAAKVGRIAATYKLRSPPRELVFLDRKLAGVFIFLSVLKCKMNARALVETRLRENMPTPTGREG